MTGRMPKIFGLCGVLFFVQTLASAAAPATGADARASLFAPENRVTVVQRGPKSATFISADRNRPIPVLSLSIRPDARAQDFLRSNRASLLGSLTPLELKTLRVDANDVLGLSHVRLQQEFSGIPIRGAQAIVHLTDAGVTAASSRLVTIDPGLNTTPVIDAAAAIQKARQLIVEQAGPVAVSFSAPVLEIVDPTIYPIASSVSMLAWFIEATGNALRERIWINAVSGSVEFHYSQLTDARNRLTYNAGNLTTSPTTPVRIESQAAIGDAEVDIAHDYAGDFYDFFFNVFGRDSYNNNGAAIESVARACRPGQPCPMDNAYWDGFRIYLGEGYGVDDVVAHELTHAVIEKSANLDYLNMSGALNESYADIFGEAVDLWNRRGLDTAAVRWLLGEDLARYRGVGLRNLMDPATRGQPSRVTDASYMCDPRVDNGGVHNNSGVPNHAFALMADGGTYNGYTISGIGLAAASEIHYRALTLYLQPGSQFIDNVDALIQACTDLVGAGSLTHDDCSQVKKTVLAVEMTTLPCPAGALPPAPPPPAPASLPAASGQCPTGQVVVSEFADDFENPLSGNWVTGAAVGANHWLGGAGVPAIYATGNAASGTYALHGTATAAVGDSFVQLNRDINVPPQALIYFQSAHDFDAGFDGGVLEYSVDAGGTWLDAGPFITAGRNYDGGLANGMSNPLGGSVAFTGHANVYGGTRLDLSSFTGSSLRFRFRFVTDRSVASPGWWIDNFSVYTCLQVSPGIEVTPLSGLQTTEQGGTASLAIVLKSPPTATVTIALSSSDSTEGSLAPTSVVFTATNWNVPQTVILTGADDAIDDGDVIYQVISANAVSSDPAFNGMSVPDVLVTNVDNDGAGIVATPASGLVTSESDVSASFTLKLQTQPTADVTLILVVDKPEEVVLSSDSEFVTFTTMNWNIPRTIYVSGVNDAKVDPATPFRVTMTVVSNDTKYLTVTTPVITGTNMDNDVAGVIVARESGLRTSELGSLAGFTVSLKSTPRSSVTIGLSSSDTSEGTVLPATLVFDAMNWNVPQAVAVVGVDDTVADGNVSYRIVTAAASSADSDYNGFNAPDVTLTNIDNETPNIVITAPVPLITGEAGIRGSFSVVLTTQPVANVEFKVSSDRPTEGQLGVTSVLFNTANWNITQTITVTGVDDSSIDGDIAYAIVTGAVISADVGYSGMDPPDIEAINLNDDIPDLVFNLPASLKTSEKGGMTQFSVALLLEPTANVALRLSSSDMSEGVVSPAALTFTTVNWNMPQIVTVTGVNDTELDGTVNYDVVIDPSFSIDTNYRQLVPRRILVSNTDDENSTQPQAGDPRSIVVTPRFGLVTSEDGDVASFTVKLSRIPTNPVDIPIRSSNTSEGRVQPSSLVFDARNWNLPQIVTIAGRDDSVLDGNRTYTIILDVPRSDDLSYSSIGSSEVSVTNRDNDQAAIRTGGGAFGPWLLIIWMLIALSRRQTLGSVDI